VKEEIVKWGGWLHALAFLL